MESDGTMNSKRWIPEVGDLVRVVESGNGAVVFSVNDAPVGTTIGLVFNPGTPREYQTVVKPADVVLVEPRLEAMKAAEQ
jgi:hypothetical protein